MKKGRDKKHKKREDDRGALFIPAGVLLGLGFGFLYGKLVEVLFIGLGLGFLIFAIVQLFVNKKKK